MAWIGKIIGAIIGFLVAGPVGALIGLALGHQFDQGSAQESLRKKRAGSSGRRSRSRPRAEWNSADRQRLFFETTFLALGHLAKADGRVSEAEISAARLVMQDLRLPQAEVRRAIEFFTAGKNPAYPMDRQVLELRQACRNHPEILRTFLEIQVGFLVAKGGGSTRERERLMRMASILGVAGLDLAHLESVLRARRSFRDTGPAPSGPGTLDGAYRALGITAAASDRDVKTAYRRLMNEHHPDKLASRGLPESMLESAKERTREIRAAYETIREHRGFS